MEFFQKRCGTAMTFLFLFVCVLVCLFVFYGWRVRQRGTVFSATGLVTSVFSILRQYLSLSLSLYIYIKLCHLFRGNGSQEGTVVVNSKTAASRYCKEKMDRTVPKEFSVS